MEKITKISNSLSIKEDNRKNRTIISVIDEDKEILLSDIKTDEYFWSKWVYDENYVVAYSRGCMVNQLPLTVEAAYSIKNKKLLNMNNEKIRDLVEFMLISKKGFDLTQVLTEINSSELGLLTEEEKENLKNYLTSGNKNIDKETIIDYILKSYPQLKQYTSLTEKLSVSKYRLIEEELDESTFWLHAIPQDLSFVEEASKKEIKKDHESQSLREFSYVYTQFIEELNNEVIDGYKEQREKEINECNHLFLKLTETENIASHHSSDDSCVPCAIECVHCGLTNKFQNLRYDLVKNFGYHYSETKTTDQKMFDKLYKSAYIRGGKRFDESILPLISDKVIHTYHAPLLYEMAINIKPNAKSEELFEIMEKLNSIETFSEKIELKTLDQCDELIKEYNKQFIDSETKSRK